MSKFTHPDNAPLGHEWVVKGTDMVAKHLADNAWAFERATRGWAIGFYAQPEISFEDKPSIHEETMWMNCYSDGGHMCHTSKGAADFMASKSRLACVKVKFSWTEEQFDGPVL